MDRINRFILTSMDYLGFSRQADTGRMSTSFWGKYGKSKILPAALIFEAFTAIGRWTMDVPLRLETSWYFNIWTVEAVVFVAAWLILRVFGRKMADLHRRESERLARYSKICLVVLCLIPVALVFKLVLWVIMHVGSLSG